MTTCWPICGRPSITSIRSGSTTTSTLPRWPCPRASLVGKLFENIARVEQTHGDRFGKFADLLEKGQLFFSDVEVQWTCLHCGWVVTSTAAPAQCPVCRHPQGYFVRVELAPWN